MDLLIGCEESGTVREAFRAVGVDAVSCDLVPSRVAGPHIIGDVLEVMRDAPAAIVFPPCTYLSVSGLHWNTRKPDRQRKTDSALEFVRQLMEFDGPLAIENPIGCISSQIRKPDQIIQPYQFGDDASKATCLWLQGFPKLAINPAARRNGRIVTCNGKRVERWSNQTDSGQNKLGPSETRARDRAVTYPGIANAMANQWHEYLTLVSR